MNMIADKFLQRYRDGYRASNWIDTIGSTIKAAGVFLAVGVWLAAEGLRDALWHNQAAKSWIADTLQLSPHRQQEIIALVGWVVALAIFSLLTLVGTLTSAIGQVMRAAFDTAVNTSPFLSVEEKRNVIRVSGSWWEEIKEEWRKAFGAR